MESTKDQLEASGKQINIDINGDADETDVKNMNLDSTTNENRVGFTRDELMKYANQPFWVRLRNILFATFWIVWVSILVAAISYVIRSPGCAVKMVSAAKTGASAAASQTTAST